MIRQFDEFPEWVFSGFGHEAVAFMILDCLSPLPSEISDEVMEEFVLKAMIECKAENKLGSGDFVDLFAARCSKYLAQPKVAYHCLFFLQVVEVPSWLLRKRILGVRLKMASKVGWKAAERYLNTSVEKAGITLEALQQMHAVEIKVEARDPVEAIATADEISRIIRGSYMASSGPPWILSGPRKSTNHFNPSPAYFVPIGTQHSEFAFLPRVATGFLRLPDECPATMGYLLKLLSDMPGKNSPKQVLQESLVLYAGSGDVASANEEFLSLWQVLERLSLVESGNTGHIAAGVANLWVNGVDTVRPQILALAELRNRLVHSGQFNPSRQSANFLLAKIVKDSLLQFARLSDELPSKLHVQELQSLMTIGKATLDTKEAVIQFARKMRKM